MPRLPMREDLDRMSAATIEADRLRAHRPRPSVRPSLLRQVQVALTRRVDR
jgi:hypothetical protein